MNLDDLFKDAGPKVYYKDLEKLKKTLTQFHDDGANLLQVLTDFDRTLTKHSHDGVVCPSTHAVLEESELFSTEFRKRTTTLRDKYYPIEMDPDIPQDEKEKLMVDWWSEGHKLLIEEHLKKSDLQSVVRESAIQFRDWYENVRHLLCTNDIPSLVFSAGIGTVVKEAFILKSSYRDENIEIISNFLHFDDHGVNVGFKGPLIHTFNKGKMSHLNREYFEKNESRKNVLMLGDTMGDLEMSKNLDENKFNILKIGFLNDKVEKNRPFYREAYDVVIEDPESMRFVLLILSYILEVKEETYVVRSPELASVDSRNTNPGLNSRELACPSAEDAGEASARIKESAIIYVE